MLRRIATWSVGALLACSLIASADAAPPKLKPGQKPVEKRQLGVLPPGKPVERLQQRENPIRSVPKTTVLTQAVYENGRLERFEEGTIFYTVELPLETRENMAQHLNVRLEKIPERVWKKATVDLHAMTPRSIKSKLDTEVSIELRQDQTGAVFATNLGLPRRK